MAEKSQTDPENLPPVVQKDWKRVVEVFQNARSQFTKITKKDVTMDNGNGKWYFFGWRTVGALVLIAGLLTVADILRDISSDKDDARAIRHSKSKLAVAETDAKRNVLEKGNTASPIVNRKTTTPVGVGYNCNSAQSVLVGFRSGKINYLSGDQATIVTGCVWLSVDQAVSNISGENFIIEFPTETNSRKIDSSLYGKSPSDRHPDPVTFWNRINGDPTLPNRTVRVLVKDGGFATFTK